MLARSAALVFVSVLLGSRALGQTTEQDVVDQVRNTLESRGYDLSNFTLKAGHAQKDGYASSKRVGPYGAMILDFGRLKKLYDASSVPWPEIDSPQVFTYIFAAAAHEYVHLQCCHSNSGQGGNAEFEEDCDEILCDIGAYNMLCSWVSSLPNPVPASLQDIAHYVCAYLADEERRLNTDEPDDDDPDNDEMANLASCWAAWGAGGYSPCRCTTNNHPGPDPCEQCPIVLPAPSTGGGPPYPNGLVTHCDRCDHI